MTAPFEPGDFVWTNFPFEADPNHPGPGRHAALIMATFGTREAAQISAKPAPKRGIAVAVYTSSQVGKFGTNPPIGVIPVPVDRALKSGNRTAFFIDVRKRAFMPLSTEYFPELDRPGFGIVGRADKGLFAEARRQFILVNERHKEMIVNLGPYRP
jgi:hypothetical protein